MATLILSLCPINWEMWTGIGTLLLAGIGIASLAYAIVQLSDFRKESKIKHLIDLVNQFESEPLATYRRTLGRKRAPNGVLEPLDLNNPPDGIHEVMNFFEHMGYLLDGKYLDLDGVSVEFHYWILHVWADAKKLIATEQTENSIYYEYFGKMVQRLLNEDRKRTGILEVLSEADFEDFYVEESHLPTGSPIPKQRRSKRRSRSTPTSERIPESF
jgi:hypothetical protein